MWKLHPTFPKYHCLWWCWCHNASKLILMLRHPLWIMNHESQCPRFFHILCPQFRIMALARAKLHWGFYGAIQSQVTVTVSYVSCCPRVLWSLLQNWLTFGEPCRTILLLDSTRQLTRLRRYELHHINHFNILYTVHFTTLLLICVSQYSVQYHQHIAYLQFIEFRQVIVVVKLYYFQFIWITM